MFHLKRGSSNSILHLKGWAFLLLIFALATTAFMPMPPEVRHTRGGILMADSSPSATLPGAFKKSIPANGATSQPTNPTLTWGKSTNTSYYEYCINTTNNCASWKSVGTKTSIALSALTPGATYYWQVRATNAIGTTYANGSSTALWSFSIALPPGDFNKSAPANAATNQPNNVTLSWNPSSNATSYQYCIDSGNNNSCDASWISTGSVTSIAMSSLTPGTTYYWQVRALNGNYKTFANGSATAWWSFTVSSLPGSFGKTKPTNGATNQAPSLLLSWGTSLKAKYYEYCIDTNNNNTCDTSWYSAGTNTSTSLNALTPGATYYWQVRAQNNTGTTYADGSSTPWYSFSIVPLPGDFNKLGPAYGTTNLPSNPTLSWSPSSNAASYAYCLETSYNITCNTSWVSTGTNTSITLSSLNPGTKYFWQVRAKNAAGIAYGDTSIWWYFKVAPLPGSFDKLRPQSGASRDPLNVTLEWETSNNATEYQYCIDTTDDDACNAHWISTGTDTSIYLDSLSPVTTYYWQVRAKSPTGITYAEDSDLDWWYFTTSKLPGDFDKSYPANGATNRPDNVTLIWNASKDADDYQFCIDTSNDNSCNNANWKSTSGDTSIAISSLTPGATYYWQVRATYDGYKTFADGSKTAWFYFTVSTLPGSFGKTSPGNGAVDLFKTLDNTLALPSDLHPGYSIGVTLEWTASKTATSYEYCIDTTNDNTCNASWISVGNNTSAAVNGLQLGGQYYWQVRARNSSGLTYADGSKTAWWSFTISPT